ncbi:hypothetical protein Ahia01_001257500 [Argonauta hians]
MDFMSHQYHPYLHQRNAMGYGSQYGRSGFYEDFGSEPEENTFGIDEENNTDYGGNEDMGQNESSKEKEPQDSESDKSKSSTFKGKSISDKISHFCSWNCFFSLMFVMGVLLVFVDHYDSAYVRMLSMQKFFFFVMGVLTTTVAVVVVIVVVAFTSCYGDGF